MLIIKAILAVLINLIIYFALGSLLVSKKDDSNSVILTMSVGFFVYYGLFCLVCLPIMFTYRPLSLLSGIWLGVVLVLVVASAVLRRKVICDMLNQVSIRVRSEYRHFLLIGALVVVGTVLIVCSFDFTLDAAYYVANVSTCVDTNMINIYDPFTGAWQDHFELRYAFATYSINDAVICQLLKLPALVQTKLVMASTVSILSNLIYFGIADTLFDGDRKKITIMMVAVFWMNLSYITIYTASNFLVSRTYEGKAILGSVTVPLIFWLFVKYIREERMTLFWILLFMVSFGSTTITSSANMLVPAEISVLFVPYIVRNKRFKLVVNYIIMLIPGIVMMLMYVLYVKGFFAISTYYRR